MKPQGRHSECAVHVEDDAFDFHQGKRGSRGDRAVASGIDHPLTSIDRDTMARSGPQIGMLHVPDLRTPYT